MGILDTKLGRLLSKDFEDSINELAEKKRKIALDEHDKYVKMVNDIHSSSIPNEIREAEMNFNFKTDFSDTNNYSLEKKKEDFLHWYYKNWIKGHCTDIEESHEQEKIIKFIEKMVLWYEMRYPDFEVVRSMLCFEQENKFVDDILLNQGIESIGWNELFDYNAFLQTLSYEEERYLKKPTFKSCYIMEDAYMGTLYISPDGRVKADGIRFNVSERHPNMVLCRSLYVTEDFDNLNLLQVKELMKKYNMLNDVEGIQKIIDDYQLQIETQSRLLDCVMYRIIGRGGSIIGPCRALLFAKEFNRNIDIPMMYDVDYSNLSLRKTY